MLADSGARMVVADQTTIETVRAAVVGVREALAASAAGQATPGPRIVGVGVPPQADEQSWDQLVR